MCRDFYRFYLNKISNDYHYAELCRVFLNDDMFETIPIELKNASNLAVGKNSFIVNRDGEKDRNQCKLELLRLLEKLTYKHNDWGTMTGVRPLKPALDVLRNCDGDLEATKRILSTEYALAEDKIQLLSDIIDYQSRYLKGNPSDKAALYVGIPFCPTRCAYCSFASNVANCDEEIEEYLHNLLKEIDYAGSLSRRQGEVLESIYIGGGTPTSLNAGQLDRLINGIEDGYGIDASSIEFTVEAGRPDTIDKDKLEVLKKHGISRISINPQTMKDETLKLIGRNHNSAQIVESYNLAKEMGFAIINADLIAGLQDESVEDFVNSLNKVIELGADNITIHTLSVKRGSRLIDEDPNYYRKNEERVIKMLALSREILKEHGFKPYYMYRQKHQIGALENVGYCKDGKHSIYNIRIMEEKQTIIGLGAGAIGKVYYKDEDRLERVPNIANYSIYSERFDEILNRKNKYYGG